MGYDRVTPGSYVGNYVRPNTSSSDYVEGLEQVNDDQFDLKNILKSWENAALKNE